MKILLAVDSSEYSAAAIKEVAKRPWPPRSTIRVLSVVEPITPPAAERTYGPQAFAAGKCCVVSCESRAVLSGSHTEKTVEEVALKLH